MTITRGSKALLFIGMWSTMLGQSQFSTQKTHHPSTQSRPLPYVKVDWPAQARPEVVSSALVATANATTASTLFKQSLQMKLLVLSADGTEPSFAAITYFLDHTGIPYDAITLTKTPLPALNDATHGLYQGIVLASGNLAYDKAGIWQSALSTTDWTNLDNYARNYGVRVVSYYTFPEARYGLALSGATGYSNTPASPALLSLTAAGSPLFPYLIPANKINVVYAYYYPSVAVAATGETTTPIMTISATGLNNVVVGATHVAADGRESLAMTMDSSPYLTHSKALNYGIFNWVTKGVFVGQRKVFLTPQSDDLFLPDDLYTSSQAGCQPTSATADPTYDPAIACPTARDSSGDLGALVTWQKGWQNKAQFKGFKLSHAFNGYGSTTTGGAAANDLLLAAAKTYKNEFYWLNHTWDHENLDCYNPVANSGICVAATYAESLAELQQNITFAQTNGFPNDTTSMVTPNISGLYNANFLQAAQAVGIKYLVSDMSYADWLPALPNTGVYSKAVPSILYIPRRATNIFYNAISGVAGTTGSLVDEYNYFYGPNGTLRLGGPGGTPFFSVNQTYAQIIDGESNALLNYMLDGEWYPSMYHQSNLVRYSGQKSLFSDVMDATMNKFAKISNLPVSSLPQTTLGQMMADRMVFNAAGVKAVYVPASGITLTATTAAKAPLTGVCAAGCATYGTQSQSMVPVAPGAPVFIPLF